MMNEATTPNQFRKVRHVHFSHCDPAGIVFFPRYLVLLNDLIEDWFNEELKIDYAHLIGVRRFGMPTVRLECDFLSPSPWGTQIEWRLQVERLGNTSITLVVEGWAADVLRFRLRTVLVATGGYQGRPVPLPDDLRMALVRFSGLS